MFVPRAQFLSRFSSRFGRIAKYHTRHAVNRRRGLSPRLENKIRTGRVLNRASGSHVCPRAIERRLEKGRSREGEWSISPEPTPTTREALLLRPELCGESHPDRGATTRGLPQGRAIVVVARVPTTHAPRKSFAYFLLVHSRNVFARPHFTCHVPLSSDPAATSKLLSR